MGGGGFGPIIAVVASLHVTGAAFGAVVPLWLLTSFMTARTFYYYSTRRRVRDLQRLADRLATLARELVPAPQVLRRVTPDAWTWRATHGPAPSRRNGFGPACS